MKTNTRLVSIGIVMCTALALLGGCQKQEAPPTAESVKPAEGIPAKPTTALDAVQPAAQAVVTQATAQTVVTQETAQAVVTQATAQAAGGEQQAQGLIDRATALVVDKKYQDALGTLGQLSKLSLTSDQQKLVDDLKAQIQKALAASALGGALGGKK